MNYLAVVVLIGLSSLAQAQYYTSSCPNGYQIQSGDTFYKLASSNLGGMCAWLNANTYPNVATTVDPCNLKVGQCVNIPTSTTSTYCPNNYSAYSCFSNYGTPTGNYYGTGYYTGPYYGTATSCPAGTYQIKSGDTLWAISGGSWAGVCAWLNANSWPSTSSNVNPCNLQVGQCLSVPTSSTSTTCSSTYTASSYSCLSGIPTGTSYGYYTGPIYSTATTSTCPAGTYQVKSGDTLWALGGSNWGGACAWINANTYPTVSSTVNPCNLQVGQCINWPSSSTSTYCPSNYNTYSCLNTYGTPSGAYYGSGYYTGPYYGSSTGTGTYTGYYSNPYGYGTGNWACSSSQRTIQSGDSFWALGSSSQAGACAWMAANPDVDPCNLRVGYCLNQPTYTNSNSNCVLPTCSGRK